MDAQTAFNLLINKGNERKRIINQMGVEYFRKGNLEQVAASALEAREINDLVKQIEKVKIQWYAIFPKQLSGPMHRTQLTTPFMGVGPRARYSGFLSLMH